MASVKAIRRRVASVKNTQKISLSDFSGNARRTAWRASLRRIGISACQIHPIAAPSRSNAGVESHASHRDNDRTNTARF